ncbi:hypothetical protein H8D79_00455, partial [PVC group bacterium]|nr:hypothetical protein [PVC group bacterium]
MRPKHTYLLVPISCLAIFICSCSSVGSKPQYLQLRYGAAPNEEEPQTVEAAVPTEEIGVPAVESVTPAAKEKQSASHLPVRIASDAPREDAPKPTVATQVPVDRAPPPVTREQPVVEVKPEASVVSKAVQEVVREQPKAGVIATAMAEPRPVTEPITRPEPKPVAAAATPVPRRPANGKGLMDFLQKVASAAVPIGHAAQGNGGKEHKAEKPMKAESVAAGAAPVPEEGRVDVDGDRITMHVTDADLSSV